MQTTFGGQIGPTAPAFSDSSEQPDLETLATAFLGSRQQIRREIARLLEEHTDRNIVGVRVALTFDKRTLDVGSLPSFLRGSLSGPGKFAGEAA